MSNAGDSGTGDISPGQSIEATATQHDISQGDLDVEIPEVEQANSPSFASQAADIPHFAGLLTKGPEHVDLTEEDARLEAAEIRTNCRQLGRDRTLWGWYCPSPGPRPWAD